MYHISHFGAVTGGCYNHAELTVFATKSSSRHAALLPFFRVGTGRDFAKESSMRSLLRPAAWFLLFALLALPIQAADSAGSLFKKGRDAEARQSMRMRTGFTSKRMTSSDRLKYRSAVERLRFLAGASHVHRGQSLREEGKLAEALAEFSHRRRHRSSSFIAQQEIRVPRR